MGVLRFGLLSLPCLALAALPFLPPSPSLSLAGWWVGSGPAGDNEGCERAWLVSARGAVDGSSFAPSDVLPYRGEWGQEERIQAGRPARLRGRVAPCKCNSRCVDVGARAACTGDVVQVSRRLHGVRLYPPDDDGVSLSPDTHPPCMRKRRQ